ncbi:hypothetical protein PROFUN_12223 [Planoprotostelium fungivorum]|uniref:Uncharacterized protein n=1 Tax=Planoprotostelium fungivorum TaxID=1890364 RepID=A0A2P6N869_9EUKA|nr:hypothetical protein PROFUN_12223 [Planoprotostelium fungivorum]
MTLARTHRRKELEEWKASKSKPKEVKGTLIQKFLSKTTKTQKRACYINSSSFQESTTLSSVPSKKPILNKLTGGIETTGNSKSDQCTQTTLVHPVYESISTQTETVDHAETLRILEEQLAAAKLEIEALRDEAIIRDEDHRAHIKQYDEELGSELDRVANEKEQLDMQLRQMEKQILKLQRDNNLLKRKSIGTPPPPQRPPVEVDIPKPARKIKQLRRRSEALSTFLAQVLRDHRDKQKESDIRIDELEWRLAQLLVDQGVRDSRLISSDTPKMNLKEESVEYDSNVILQKMRGMEVTAKKKQEEVDALYFSNELLIQKMSSMRGQHVKELQRLHAETKRTKAKLKQNEEHDATTKSIISLLQTQILELHQRRVEEEANRLEV